MDLKQTSHQTHLKQLSILFEITYTYKTNLNSLTKHIITLSINLNKKFTLFKKMGVFLVDFDNDRIFITKLKNLIKINKINYITIKNSFKKKKLN